MKIQTKVHTIFLFIGPTESGKTTFAKEVLIPSLSFQDESRNFKSNVQYISSDELREELLGSPHDKYDPVMTEVSAQAFHLLFEKLKQVTTFPVNAEFVVVDTTGLSEEFRDQVVEIARQNHYNVEAVLFDYKNREDYYASERSKRLISQHVSRLKREVIPNLRRSSFQKVHRIREKNFDSITVEIENKTEYLESILPHDTKYVMVGDVHEQIDALQQLITSFGFTLTDGVMQPKEKTEQTKFILLGDWIDKGKQTKETIEFLFQNKDYFLFIKGNHENFVSRCLKGELEPTNLEYFDSLPVFQKDEELTNKFFALLEGAKESFRFIGKTHPSYVITHAPVHSKYIGKLDDFAKREQRNFRLDRNEEIEPQLSFLEEDGASNFPFHIFGHVSSKRVFRIKNKMGIDTGAGVGHELTAITIDSHKPYIRSVKIDKQTEEELPILFAREKTKVNLDELDENDQKRLDFILKNRINFIAGTTSPADQDKEKGDLESLEKGLLYYKKHGVNEVVLQPKYMGSRCNIYLYKDLEQCFATSRNGYKIQHVDLTPVYETLQQKFASYMVENKIQMMLLDGELLPWMALGKGLIESQFNVVDKALETEIEFLKQNGFDEQLTQLISAYQATDFEQDSHHMPKKQLLEKYGDASYQTFKHVQDVMRSYYPLDVHESAYRIYREQLEIYAQDAPMEFKPFSLLKVQFENGEEVLPQQKTSVIFSTVTDDEYIVLDLQDENSFAQALDYFNHLTQDEKMEGIMIKPEVVSKHLAPCLKVRNKRYLSIIYGYDYQFPHKLNKLIQQKNTRQKLRTSISEYQIGMQMLRYSMDEIDPSNQDYKQVVANMLFENKKESDIDPRL